jgi:hypothetical protein
MFRKYVVFGSLTPLSRRPASGGFVSRIINEIVERD